MTLRAAISTLPAGDYRPTISGGIGDVATASVGASLVTRQFARKVDVSCNAFKVRLYNVDSAAHANVKACIAIVDGSADPYGSTATWTNLTFSGSGTVTIPAGSGSATIPNHTFGVVDSDTVYLTAAVGQIFLIRVYDPNANATRFEHPTLSPNMANNGLLPAFWNGDGVTTPGSFVPTYTNTCPAAQIVTLPAQSSKLWVVGGASTNAGQGDTTQLGWARRTETLMASAGRPIGCVNISHPGAQTPYSLARVQQHMTLFKPTFATWSPFSTNDAGITLADIPRLKGQALTFLDSCAANNSTPILVTFQPNAVATGDLLTIMQAINQYCRDLAAQNMCLCLDFQLLFSGSTTGTTWLDPANTTDGTHPNAQGHAVAAQYAYDTIFRNVI